MTKPPALRHGLEKEPSQRQLRVGEAVRSALAQVFLEENFYGTSMQGISITVSEARVSPDLKNVTVFVLPLGGKAPADFIHQLNDKVPYFRHVIGKKLALRYTPHLVFVRDDSFDEAHKIHSLLDKI